jgi:hypothetical protein
MRRTDRDLYWGAKVVTSFSDPQLAAIVAAARLPEKDAAYMRHALSVRRDVIGRRYLRPMTAVENPALTGDGSLVCFDDLAIQRGYTSASETSYDIEVGDGHGNRLATGARAASGPRSCVSIGPPGPGSGYRIVQVVAHLDGPPGRTKATAKASRIHLRWRTGEGRFVVVGLERDE